MNNVSTIKCNECDSNNRESARYCKYCGCELQIAKGKVFNSDLDELVGLIKMKNDINTKMTAAKNMQKAGRNYDKRKLHTILIGNTGTAKSKIPDALAKIFFKNGIISKPDAKIVNAVDFINFTKDIATNLNSFKGSILFIDEVHKLVPAQYIPGQTTHMDKLYAEMDKMNGDPIIILASRPEGFKEYLEKNPEVKNRFSLIFDLPDLSYSEMYEIAVREFKKHKFILTPEAEFKLKMLIKNMVVNNYTGLNNGHTVNKIVDDIIENHFNNPDFEKMNKNTIIEEDIKGEIFEDKTMEQIFSELDNFVGMKDIKLFIRNMVERIEIAKIDAEKTGNKYTFGEHLIFTGNPGTGKTTLARKLGEIFASIGLLSKGHVVEVDRSKLVGQFVGSTAINTQKLCDDAKGGILFIDEAYTLKQHDNDNFGQESIDTLLKRMEDGRGDMMVIAAGYKKEMQSFINSNPGLKSRFKEDNIFELKDYTPDELFEIYKIFVKKGKLELDIDAEPKLYEIIKAMYVKRDRYFGNGREVRNLVEKCLSRRAARLRKPGVEHDLILYSDDLPDLEAVSTTPNVAMKELDSLIGLNSVKNEIRGLIDYLEVEKIRSAEGGKNTDLNIHFIFKGNPGTGKTTVARVLASVFKAMGLLTKGHLVETDRKDLVAEYIGHTAGKTSKVIDSALGGVLFIDEAYTLSSSSGSDFRKEAIETLLKRMEDERGKFIVIAAGYSNEMEMFLNSNPGLTSRFSKHIVFEDYTPEEMSAIFRTMVKSKNMTIDEDANISLLNIFTDIFQRRDKNFANGRTVRNFFESALQNQAARISLDLKSGKNIKSDLNILTVNDLGIKK